MVSNPAYSQNLTKRGGNWYTKFRDYILPPTATQNKKLVSIPANQQIIPPKNLPNDVFNVIIGKHVTNAVHSPDEILQLLKMNKDSAHGILTSGSPEVYKNIPNAIAQLSKDGNNLALLKMIYEYPNLVDWKSANQPSKYIMTQDEFAKLSTDILNPPKTPGIISREPKTSEIQFYNFLGKNMKTINDNLSDQNKGIIYSNYFKSLMGNQMMEGAEYIFKRKSMFIENDVKLMGLIMAMKFDRKYLFQEIDKFNPVIREEKNAKLFASKIKTLIELDNTFYLEGMLRTASRDPRWNLYLKVGKRMEYALHRNKLKSFEILAKYWFATSISEYGLMLHNFNRMKHVPLLKGYLIYHGDKIPNDYINAVFRTFNSRISFDVSSHSLDVKFANEFIKNEGILLRLSEGNLLSYFKTMTKYSGSENDRNIFFSNSNAIARISDKSIENVILKINSSDKLQSVLKYPAVKDRLSQETLSKLREKFSIEI